LQHAITKDGPLVTRQLDGRPITDYTFGKGKSKDIAQTAAAGLTAECLWTASQHKGDCKKKQFESALLYQQHRPDARMLLLVLDHLMMNSEMFMKWVQGRLMPTFEALYGPGTELGGEQGKKMIVIMGKCNSFLCCELLHPSPHSFEMPVYMADNAPYHHKRSFTSFSAMKTKKDLIENMIKVGVTQVTLPAKEGLRSAPNAIDLSERIDSTEAYAPAVTSNLSAANDSAEFFKYKYAERATRDGMIPTTEELKGVCVKEMNDNHQDKLQCDVQKLLKENGHTWLWTPAYCPWLQPIETFWAHGKNYAASKNRNGEHSARCVLLHS
jgi:hypothetical protein